jgi:5-methylcytosine-specific restriction endonuclease McrA
MARGEKHYNWQGGKSFEPYTIDWNNTLKIAIRERDRYICQLCGEKQGDTAHCIHHIDYNKKNCNSNNLITLCRSCHVKTNYRRDYWIKYFYG